MRRLTAIVMIAGTLAIMAGCSKSPDHGGAVPAGQNTTAATEETAGKPAGTEAVPGKEVKPGNAGFVVMPAYKYSGDDKYMNSMLEKLMEVKGSRIRQADVTIPDIVVVKIDDSDPQDIKIWNYARVFSFRKEDRNLVAVDGSEVLGLFHMKETVNGFEVISWEKNKNGDDAAVLKSVRKICDNDENLTADMIVAYRKSDMYHTAIMRMYVEENHLDIDSYTIKGKTCWLKEVTTIEDGSETGYEGVYIQREDDSSLEIHSLGNGTFSVKMALAGRENLSGTGVMEGEVLNCTLETEDKKKVYCADLQENDLISVNVFKSEWDQVPVGENLQFYSAADVSTEFGAPSTAEAIE